MRQYAAPRMRRVSRNRMMGLPSRVLLAAPRMRRVSRNFSAGSRLIWSKPRLA